ncbi:MAG: YcnI family protein [Rhodococcus sp.]|nr:YcnI family protein [Rhodococcus sp. (in: high G+C Gram-positive bacteria)]
MKSLFSRALITGAATSSVLLLGAGIAAAHVTVVAPGAAQGGYSVLTFRVPTESDAASTTALRVELPDLKSARTEPIPGWTAVIERDDTTQAATAVTWTADPGVGVQPGQFQQFVLSAGPLPATEDVAFPAIQTYSDGEVVAWDEAVGADGSEPSKPAPTLTLAPSSGDGHGHSVDSGSSSESASATHTSEAGADNVARLLGGGGLVLGALGAALGLGAVIRGRR